MKRRLPPEIKEALEEYLINRGFYRVPNANNERKKRIVRLADLWTQVTKRYGERTADNLLEHVQVLLQGELARAETEEEREVLEDLQGFLETLVLIEEEEERPEEDEVLPSVPPTHEGVTAPERRPSDVGKMPVIGRVAVTQHTPADALTFPFWVRQDAGLTLGEIVTAEDPQRRVRVVGVVQDLKSYTLLEGVGSHYLACDVGTPETTLPTEIPVLIEGRAGILWRSDNRNAPPEGDWPLRRAMPQEIRQALCGDIPIEWAAPAGFIFVRTPPSERPTPVPVDMDLRWVIGYEAGHINIAGISGVAAKTSYALFLVTSLLAAAQRQTVRDEGGLAVITFNVKEQDLLYLDRCEKWRAVPRSFQDDQRMWDELIRFFQEDGERFGVPVTNITTFFQPLGEEIDHPGMRLFTPGAKGNVASLRQDDVVEAFRYGWEDLREERMPFYALFDPDDLDDRMLGAIEALLETKGVSWEGARDEITRIAQGTRSRGDWVTWNHRTVHRATLYKLYTRLQAIEEAMGDLLDTTNTLGHPLPIDELRPGQIWIIDITRIGDRARRYLFYRLLRELNARLEKRKAGDPKLRDFPGRVLIMVDELNRFAPAGRGRHPVREQLVSIASQGRSVGLTLLGLEQLASRIDDEILVNTANLFLGRSHPAEMAGASYAWMRSLRDQVITLPTGTMVGWHPKWRQPIFLRFPRPLHRLHEEAEKAERTRGTLQEEMRS